MDVWAAIIAGFKAASPGMVSVLGSVDSSTTTSAYDDLDVDGFYFVGVNQSIKPKPYSPFSPTSDPTRVSVAAIGTPLFDETEVDVATVEIDVLRDIAADREGLLCGRRLRLDEHLIRSDRLPACE